MGDVQLGDRRLFRRPGAGIQCECGSLPRIPAGRPNRTRCSGPRQAVLVFPAAAAARGFGDGGDIGGIHGVGDRSGPVAGGWPGFRAAAAGVVRGVLYRGDSRYAAIDSTVHHLLWSALDRHSPLAVLGGRHRTGSQLRGV